MQGSMVAVVAWLPTLTACGLVLAGWVGRRHVAGTTLVGPWAWAVAGLAFWGWAEAWMAWTMEAGTGEVPTLRYVSGSLLLCPAVSVLGAKRPQDGPWHFIVASLWLVLLLPAVEAYFVRRGGQLLVHDARGWFLWGLMAMGVANHAGTRFTAAAALWGLGLVGLLAPQLPLLAGRTHGFPLAASLCFLLSAAACWRGVRRASSAAPAGWDRLWCDFRDLYGVLWALRLVERFNALAAAQDWPCRLSWRGLIPVEGTAAGGVRLAERALVSLLRRFVSADWIAARLECQAAFEDNAGPVTAGPREDAV